MTDPTVTTPVEVKRSSVQTDPIIAALSSLLAFALGFAVNKKWLTSDQALQLTPIVLALALAAWRYLVSRAKSAKLVTTASAAPDSVAIVKP